MLNMNINISYYSPVLHVEDNKTIQVWHRNVDTFAIAVWPPFSPNAEISKMVHRNGDGGIFLRINTYQW